MPRRCTVCDHADRESIDHALATNTESIRSIAKHKGLHPNAVLRHRDSHLGLRLARAVQRREDRQELSADALIQRLVGYLEEAEHGIAKAKQSGDLTGLARCIKEARETAVYIGKTIGLWADRRGGDVTVNISDNRRYAQLISQLTPNDRERILDMLGKGELSALPGEVA